MPDISSSKPTPTPSPFPVETNREKLPRTYRLIVKLTVATLLSVILPVVLASIIFLHTFTPVLLIIPVISSLFLVVLFWYFLKPLDSIAEGVRLFSKGEFAHRIKVLSNDEFENIAGELNIMAGQLEGHSDKVTGAKEVLSSDKNKLNLIFSSINDGIIVLDIHQQIALVNPAAEKFTGYSSSEMTGKKISELLTLTDRADKIITPEVYAPVKLTENKTTGYSSGESLIIIGKDKAITRNAKVISSPIEDTSTDLGCIIILHDTTSEKELEAIQLDFVSMASHELRTPLTSVTGYLSIFLKENEGKLDAHQKDFLDRVQIAAQQLGGIINNLLNVAKVERGAFSMANANVDWKALLQKTVEENRLQAVQKNISLELKLDEGVIPNIAGDEVRLVEVLNNLIANAINYTATGGRIEVSCKKEGDMVTTCVKDTGRGIPKEALPHLFTKFFRVQGALDQASNSKGTGLGLYISKSIVDLHHGKIWAESELGKGSSFCFSLPVKPQS